MKKRDQRHFGRLLLALADISLLSQTARHHSSPANFHAALLRVCNRIARHFTLQSPYLFSNGEPRWVIIAYF